MEASPSLTPTPPRPIGPSITSCTAARIFLVPTCAVETWWPQVERHIRRWLDYDGLWSVEGVRDEISAGRARLWCMCDRDVVGVWVTRIENSDAHRWGLVWGCAGDFGPYKTEAIEAFRVIEDWFRSYGCEFAEWSGREGWSRILPDYECHAVVLRKRL